MLSVFDYMNYRKFLQDFYEEKKRERSGFTYARFSALAGIRSPNYLKLVIDGEKNLTPENVVRFARAVGLREAEADYFEALVHFNQAKNPIEKEFHQSRLNRIQNRAESVKTLEEYEFEAISSWLHHALMVMTNLKRFRNDPTWISEHVYGLAKESEVREVLKQLEQIRFIERDEEGRLRQTHRQVKTKADLQRLSARMFYEGLLKRSIQALQLSSPEEREFCTYIVGLSAKQLPELKRRVRDFMKDLNAWAMENQKPTQVYSLCFSGFPLTSSTE